jgi:hypothetical protein
MFAFLQPKLTISEADLRSGLRALTAQGTVMMGFDAETAARQAIDDARESVNHVPGVTPEEAIAEVTQGMIDATDSKPGDHADRVRRVAAGALNNNRVYPISDELGSREQD